MKITYVKIENWRSIKSVEFAPSDITVLVGSNNAGKTNILSAINFLLGERWPMPANLLDSDFYLSDRDRHIEIVIHLEHPYYSKIDFHTARDSYQLQAYDKRGIAIRGFSNPMRAEMAFAYVDAARNFEKQFSLSRWTLFGQALRSLHDNLKADAPRINNLREMLSSAHELLKTDHYDRFEGELRKAFADQLRTANYDVKFEFRTIDETNLYRSLYPTLIEGDAPKNPAEVGSGVRNLLVLALFQAFARTFKGSAVLGVEEPELYLHPHAQRSLMRQFEELAAAGNQIFISSHSPQFLDITKSERIVLVDRCLDDEEEICTQVRTSSRTELLALRQALHPERQMNEDSLRAFLRNVQRPEMAEAFFSRLCVLVEGASEAEALPIYARHLELPFDEHGISIVQAGGKNSIDTIRHVYAAHNIPTYVIFDNDEGKSDKELRPNLVLCRMLGISESLVPTAGVFSEYAVLHRDWETQTEIDVELEDPFGYGNAEVDARTALFLEKGRNKPLVARYVASKMIENGTIPRFVKEIIESLRDILYPQVNSGISRQYEDYDNEIPF